MDADLIELVTEIRDALRVCDFDASLGWRRTPLVVPSARVSMPSLASEAGPVLGQYTRSCTLYVQAWERCADAEADALTLAALRLASRLFDALDEQRLAPASPLYALPEFRVSAAAIVGEEARTAAIARLPAGDMEVPAGVVAAAATVTFAFRRRTGLSGKDAP